MCIDICELDDNDMYFETEEVYSTINGIARYLF